MFGGMKSDIFSDLDEINFDEILSKVSEELSKNPKFEESLKKEINYIYIKTANTKINVDVSLDGKTISIISCNPVVDCTIPEFIGNNKAFILSKIYLNGENMYVDYSQGVLFDRKKLEELGIRTTATYEFKLETLYSLKCINKYGIEYSNSSYSDSYPLNKKERDIDLREQTLSSFHRPTFNEYKLPKASIHVLNANVRNAYRKEGEYSIIHTNVAKIDNEGYKDVSCALFTTHYLFPDMLRGDKIIAKAVCQDGRYIFVIQEDYAESIEKAFEKAKEELKPHLIEKKDELGESAYEFLINNI